MQMLRELSDSDIHELPIVMDKSICDLKTDALKDEFVRDVE
jgi:hypothetical protein